MVGRKPRKRQRLIELKDEGYRFRWDFLRDRWVIEEEHDAGFGGLDYEYRPEGHGLPSVDEDDD